MSNLTLPSVHLRATRAEALYEQVTGVAQAAHALLKALDEAAPNARDYYPQGPDAFKRAAEQHRERVAKVRTIVNEMMEIAEHVVDAGPFRRLRSEGRSGESHE